MARGRLIILEGPEGAGKSTQLRRLAEWLAQRGIAHIAVREPGGTPVGNEIRRLLLDPASEIPPRAEALLFMASRAALTAQVIEPALARGEIVLADRFFLSTYAYQIAGRGLPAPEVRAANVFATHGLVPDLTFLFTVPADDRRMRQELRGAADRMEQAGAAFHERVEHAFAMFLSHDWQVDHSECGPIVALDGEGTEDEVFERLLTALGERWPELFPAVGESRA